jgi:hemerythrin
MKIVATFYNCCEHNMVITWNSGLELGIRAIDLQHRQLVDLINELGVAVACSPQDCVEAEILSRLVAYALFHFSDEEAIAAKLDDATHLRRHRHEHRLFTERMTNWTATPPAAVEMIAYLENWTVDHISRTDRELGQLLARQSAKGGR